MKHSEAVLFYSSVFLHFHGGGLVKFQKTQMGAIYVFRDHTVEIAYDDGFNECSFVVTQDDRETRYETYKEYEEGRRVKRESMEFNFN